MSVYTPATLAEPAATTASAVTIYTATTGSGAVMRTFQFNGTTAHNVTLSFTTTSGADSVTKRLLDHFSLKANIPYLETGWWVLENGANQNMNVWSDSIATSAPVFGAWGYTFV